MQQNAESASKAVAELAERAGADSYPSALRAICTVDVHLQQVAASAGLKRTDQGRGPSQENGRGDAYRLMSAPSTGPCQALNAPRPTRFDNVQLLHSITKARYRRSRRMVSASEDRGLTQAGVAAVFRARLKLQPTLWRGYGERYTSIP